MVDMHVVLVGLRSAVVVVGRRRVAHGRSTIPFDCSIVGLDGWIVGYGCSMVRSHGGRLRIATRYLRGGDRCWSHLLDG